MKYHESKDGEHFWIIITTGLQNRHSREMYRNKIKQFLNKVVWTAFCSAPLISEPALTCFSLLIYWYERLWISSAVYIQCKRFIFWNSTTKTYGQVCLGRKSYQDSLIGLFTATLLSITTYNHMVEIIFSATKVTQRFYRKVTFIVWCFITKHLLSQNEMKGTEQVISVVETWVNESLSYLDFYIKRKTHSYRVTVTKRVSIPGYWPKPWYRKIICRYVIRDESEEYNCNCKFVANFVIWWWHIRTQEG